jgi:integrase
MRLRRSTFNALANSIARSLPSSKARAVAHLEHDQRFNIYRIRFRYAGREYKRSLKTDQAREAHAMRGRIEETILLLERGRLEMPANADPAEFILSDGRRGTKPAAPTVFTLGELFKHYEENLLAGTKEKTTRSSEKIHQAHLLKHLKSRTVLRTLTPADIQSYVANRLRDTWRKKPVQAETIKKEIATLRMIWNCAVNQGILEGTCPVRGIRFPKRDEKPPFMTLAEAERILGRGGLTKEQEREIWGSVFLTREEVHELLEHVRKTASQPFVYPMFVFAAHTGARRSEILNSRIDDFDFEAGTVLLREKKRSRKLGTTYRRVDLTPLLLQVMQHWFDYHPGGLYTINDARRLNSVNGSAHGEPLYAVAAQKYFRRVLKGTRFAKLRGFHIFRHSFASNLASLGVDQRIIDDMMGHCTEEMRHRYRHLLPSTKRAAVALLMPETELKVVSA